MLIGFILASIHFADAQQLKKIARIGFLSQSSSNFYQHHLKHSVRACAT
jgi:hypothetical protein